MTATEQQVTGQKQEYLTKKVTINGQFVTLYSLNGQTWLSSPEEIPEVMARLDNARVTLNDPAQQGEAAAAGEEPAPAGDKKAGEKKAGEKEKSAAPVIPPSIGSKYRLKGPKPRPILKQNGMVFRGTPVEPFSASAVQVKAEEKVEIKSAKANKVKLKAPVRAEQVAAAKAAKALPKGKPIKAAPAPAKTPAAKQAKSPVKTAPPVKAKAKPVPAPRVVKGSLKKAEPVKKGAAPKAKAKPAPTAKKPKSVSKRSAK